MREQSCSNRKSSEQAKEVPAPVSTKTHRNLLTGMRETLKESKNDVNRNPDRLALFDAEGRAPGDSRVRPVMGEDQRNIRHVRVHAPAHEALLEFAKKRLQHLRNPTADHQDVRIEQINNIAQPRRQQFDRLLENLPRQR